uniref:Uncharacterized protein n=1 Tax=Anopheles farauti TaxID=69004 RepID=A0A182QVF3_9DIPT
MPTEEEQQQTGPSSATPDSTKQTETVASKDDPVAPEKPPTSDAIEEPSDHYKTEAERRRPEVSDDVERSETSATEPSASDSSKKSTEEGSTTEPEVTPEDGGSIAAGSDPNSRLIAKPESSPQPDTAPTQQEDGGDDSQALSEDEEDGDYIPDEEVKKTIMVGSDFQAVIPEGLCRYDDALPYENEDKLLWNPTILNEQEIEDYLVKSTAGPGAVATAATAAGNLSANATAPGTQQKGAGAGTTGPPGTTPPTDPQSAGVYAIPLGNHLRDDEQSLYLLQQCGHNVDEALRRKRISNNAVPVPEQQMSIWSEEECRNFENGLRVHGKDFHMIQQTKVRTRSVGELVQFYYLWKKTERHDLFASKARLEKKKYNLHPGLTDHMDRFLEEQENSTGFGDRSSSPGFNSLYSSASEAKRQRLLDSKENNTATAKRSASNL